MFFCYDFLRSGSWSSGAQPPQSCRTTGETRRTQSTLRAQVERADLEAPQAAAKATVPSERRDEEHPLEEQAVAWRGEEVGLRTRHP